MNSRALTSCLQSDDDSMGDFWRDVNAARQQKRTDNRASSAEVLTKAGIAFESKNDGAHLIVKAIGRTFDFWPGTGLWMERGKTRRFRGVRNLLAAIQPAGNTQ